MNKTLIIVPTYNERENLPTMAQRLSRLPIPVDLLVVDDNSPDGTGQIADELAAKNPVRSRAASRARRTVWAGLIAPGFGWALERDYEFIMEMDGDFSHNPDDIPRFIEAAQNAELVFGSRYCNGIRVINWPMKRHFAQHQRRPLRALGSPECHSAIRRADSNVFAAARLQSIQLDAVRSNGYSFQIEMTHKIWHQGMRVVEMPIIFTERFQGHSKMSRKIVWEALAVVWVLLLQNGLRRSPGKEK